MTIVPHDQLQPGTLRALIEEFVTRHGAVHGHDDVLLDAQVQQVLGQLSIGQLAIVFDEASESCTIATREELRSSDTAGDRHIEPVDD